MPLFRYFRVLRTERRLPAWIATFRLIVAGAVLVSLATILIEAGLRLRLPAWGVWTIRVLDWLVLALFAADIVIGYVLAVSRWRHFRQRWLDLAVFIPLIISFVLIPSGLSIVAIRQFVIVGQFFTRSRRLAGLLERLRLYPVQVAALSFVGLIIAGTVLLTFPAATADGLGTPLVDAFFTATSVVCVTGLIVRDTPVFFSRFGQLTILVLIQLGGLGIMTFAAGVAAMLGRRLGAARRKAVSELVEDTRPVDIVGTVRYVVIFTFAAEALGTLLLFARFLPDFRHAGEALYHAAFHSVSAFCNAGFSTFSDSFSAYAADPAVNIVVAGLIVTGGFGFVVVHELLNRRTLRAGPVAALRRLTLHSRLVLWTSGLLLVLGALVFFFFEYDNALARLPLGGRLIAALFQSVTTRTAGFNTVSFAALRPVTLFTCIVLMFVGASPGGTGGGIKVTTLAILMLAAWSRLRGREQLVVRRRLIPLETIFRATAIAAISAGIVVVFFSLLLMSQGGSFENLLFETVSAFGTVGLSTGLTADLGPLGRVLVAVLMYIGRLGPLTLALALRARAGRRQIRYPEAPVAIG